MSCYNKDFDSVLLTHSVLKGLGGGSLDTFLERIKSQKIQYFAQVFKVSPAYDFNLYIRGPYSPTLASDLFQLKSEKITSPQETFTPVELNERFVKAKNFISGKDVRSLELVSTLHWLREVAGQTPNDSINRLKALKEPSESELKSTLTSYEELCKLLKE